MNILTRIRNACLVLFGKVQFTIEHEIGVSLMALADDVAALAALVDTKLAAHAGELQTAKDAQAAAEAAVPSMQAALDNANANAANLQAQIDAAATALAAESAKLNAA